ncbi:MAG: hypothetical protein AB7R89_06265 [Dehalococcoidia bacterium]
MEINPNPIPPRRLPEPLPLVDRHDGTYLTADWPPVIALDAAVREQIAAGTFPVGEVRVHFRFKNAHAVYRLSGDAAELIDGTAPLPVPGTPQADEGRLGYKRGQRVYFDSASESWFDLETEAPFEERPCPSCNRLAEPGGPDPCLGMIPGAIGACCGHGVHPGYLQFPGQPAPAQYTHGVYTGPESPS